MHKPSKNFASEKPDSNGNPGKAVTCAIKSNAGHLFMCEKFFVFLIRPAVIVKVSPPLVIFNLSQSCPC